MFNVINRWFSFLVFEYASKRETQRVYVWGLADTGALGLADYHVKKNKYIIKHPKRLPFGEYHKVIV